MQKLIMLFKAIEAAIKAIDANVDFNARYELIDPSEFGEHQQLFEPYDFSPATHVLVHYNADSDELDALHGRVGSKNYDEHSKRFNLFYFLFDDAFFGGMQMLGYEHVETHDGSGNGLYYGLALYRKPASELQKAE